MKAKNVIPMTLCLIPALAFLSGCATPAPTEFVKPTYDNSHALLIEQTIRELPIADAISSIVSPHERIVVASVETTERWDYGVNYMIDDNHDSWAHDRWVHGSRSRSAPAGAYPE